MQLLSHSPTSGMGERIKRVKRENLGVEIKTPFNGESKSWTCKQSKTCNSFITSYRQESFLPSLGDQGSIMYNKVTCHHSERLPHSSPIFYFLKLSYDMEHSLGQLEHSVPSQLLMNTQQGWCRRQKRPRVCKHCSAITQTYLCYQLCFQNMPKTWPFISYYQEKLCLPPGQNQYILKVCVFWI